MENKDFLEGSSSLEAMPFPQMHKSPVQVTD